MSGIFRFFKRSPRIDIDAMMESARPLIENGHNEEACEVLERLVAAEPRFGPAWHWLGLASMHSGRLVRARQAIEEARRLSPSDEEIATLLRSLESSERLAAIMQRTGGQVLMGEGGDARVVESVEHKIRELDAAERHPTSPECRICHMQARVSAAKSPAVKRGIRCERCSTFYCGGCLDDMLRYSGITCLGCRAAKAYRPEGGGEVRLEGFRQEYHTMD